jgi:hypothetical protein
MTNPVPREKEVLYGGSRPPSSSSSAGFQGAYMRDGRRYRLVTVVGFAVLASLLTFVITWAISTNRPVSVTFVNPNALSQTTPSATSTPTATVPAVKNSGQVALTESELKLEVAAVGGSVYWAGPRSGYLYTFNHIAAGQDFVRYLPSGKGVLDTKKTYRVIATYHDAKAYQTMQAAGKLSTGVLLVNPDGSVIYYAKATPTHVYMANKTFPYQIEIFDPTPGESLKLAKTPGLISAIK